MPAPLTTEAVVLRSIRYGEADRILHLYTPDRGRLAAIAKGVRRSRSRFGARLEPFFHVHMVLHEGRGELHTVTGVDTIGTHAGLRDHAHTLAAAAHACDAVSRLFETEEPHPDVFRLLLVELALASADPARVGPANGLAFRLKLLLAAGIVPRWAPARPAARANISWGSRPPTAASCVGRVKPRGSRSTRTHTGFWFRRWAARLRTRRWGRIWFCDRWRGRSLRPPTITPTSGCGRSWGCSGKRRFRDRAESSCPRDQRELDARGAGPECPSW